jgi:hypothetical protein
MAFAAPGFETALSTVPEDSLDFLIHDNSNLWTPETIDSTVALSSATSSALPPSSCTISFIVQLLLNYTQHRLTGGQAVQHLAAYELLKMPKATI